MRRFLIVTFLSLVSVFASGQRQSSGRLSFEAYAGFGRGMTLHVDKPDFHFAATGGGAALSIYDFSGRTVVGADVFITPLRLVEPAIYDSEDDHLIADEDVHYFRETDVTATGGYMYRFWATRSRAVSFSAGGHLLLGVAVCENLSGYLKPGSQKNYSSSGFYMGLIPEVQGEYFPLRNVSAFVSFRPRLRVLTTLGGESEWFQLYGCVGLKVHF